MSTQASKADEQFLTFQLGGEEYAIEILKVQEIRGFSPVTPIPNTPPYIRGVMNLRGAVVPVVDLRAKFSLDEAAYTQFTVIIVVRIGAKVVGLVVDAVSDVLDIARDAVEATPELGAGVDTSFLTGIAKSGDKLIALLDIDKVVGPQAVALAERE